MHATDAPAQTSVSAQDVARQLLDLWGVCMRQGGNQATYALFAELDLSLTQMKALHMLESCPEELSVKELSDRLPMSMPTASRLAESLQQRGWPERLEDEHDRRTKRVRIPADGHEV